MRTFLNALAALLCVFLIAAVAVATWFFGYTSDLPDMNAVERFAPTAPAVVYAPCHQEPINAIPAQQMGANVRAAIRAAEPEWLWSSLIARSLFCEPRETMRHAVDVDRVDAHLHLRFTKEERLTIFANRMWFGEGGYGVQNAARHFFHKDARDLTVPEAAFLAGLIRAPAFYSRHPERALERRNAVLERMAAQGSLTPSEAKAAEAEPLPSR